MAVGADLFRAKAAPQAPPPSAPPPRANFFDQYETTAPHPPTRTFADYAGMGGRAVMRGVEGVGRVGELLATPITAPLNAAADALGLHGRAPTADQAADALRFAKPVTPEEELGSAAVSGITGGLLTAGLAPELGLVPQVVGGATSGLASEKVRQSGGGTGLQLLAGLAAGGLGVTATERALASLPPKLARVVAAVPEEMAVTPKGDLTPDGREAAVRANVHPEELKKAYREVAAANDDAAVAPPQRQAVNARPANDAAPVREVPPPVNDAQPTPVARGPGWRGERRHSLARGRSGSPFP